MCLKKPSNSKPNGSRGGGPASVSAPERAKPLSHATTDLLEAFPLEVVFLVEMCLPVQSLIGKANTFHNGQLWGCNWQANSIPLMNMNAMVLPLSPIGGQ